MFPVEVRYRPIVDDDADDDSGEPRDQTQAICDAIAELSRTGPGDVLVFLSGEREIRDTADALRKQQLRDTEILPLYARLSSAEQHRVFQPHRGRRIILATNVAETSLTVPGIRYVVDPGTARISRYSSRLKVQRLPIEAISQASANQRTGRCGRLEDGVCIVSTRRRTSSDGRSSPIPRFSVRTSHQFSAETRSTSATLPPSRSSIRPIDVRYVTASTCCTNSALSSPSATPRDIGSRRLVEHWLNCQ